MRTKLLALIALLLSSCVMAQKEIQLPVPSKSGGMPLMEALSKRSTNRSMDSTRHLSEQQLSDLVWAAWGINRPDGRRTAPSALNRQEIDLYLIGRSGAYLYDAKEHKLIPVAEGDHRAEVNNQEFTKTGDWILIFVADYSRMNSDDAQRNAITAGIDAGLIAQNVYLYGASEGLAVVVHMSLNQKEVAEILHLDTTQHIVMGQTVGLPAK